MLHALCPVCKKPLAEKDNCAVCENGHLFDKAKEGYYNLLLSSDKNSKDPGDNKQMVAARRDFLDGGYYFPLSSAICEVISSLKKDSLTLLDAGTGTGYYLSEIIRTRGNEKDSYIAVDISKHAVKICAKRNPKARCAVCGVYDLPYPDSLADVVVCVFSPYAFEEYSRVLKKDGILIVAYPCENHLIELRSALYSDVRSVATSLPKTPLELIDEKEICYSFSLEGKQIPNLLAMTPYAYRAPKDAIERLQKKTSLHMTADFHISVLKKSTD